jgi:hypothetical protein
MLDPRKILCLAKGGSHAYGLSTPTSDLDWRGVFVNTSSEYLVGLKKDQILTEQNSEKDNVMFEFRHTLRLLRQANTQIIELLYQERYEQTDPFWFEVRKVRDKLVDSEKLFTCLRGYMQGELRLANGERTGKLGGKRKAAIDQHGFSPKNFVQYFRLAWAGRVYFQKGYFPVNVFEENKQFGAWLLDIKKESHLFDVNYLNDEAKKAEEFLVLDYENRRFTTYFDDNVANDLCVKVYKPLIVAL